MNPRISIIILNWNGWLDTAECLESLYKINYDNYNIILVDNGSENDSIERIKKYCDGKISIESKFFKYAQDNKPIKIIEYTREKAEMGGGNEREVSNLPANRKLTLIKNDKNYGFAEGNNIGMRYALKALGSDYILLLNNDTIVAQDFLEELIKVGESKSDIGIVGPKMYYYDFDGKMDVINFAGGRFNVWLNQPYLVGARKIDEGQYDKIEQVDFITGACLLIKRDVLGKIALLNSDYFSSWEENDLCFRAYKAGYKSFYVPKSRVWHKDAASTKNNKNKTFVYYFYGRNRFLFMKEHLTKLQQCLSLIYFFTFIFWVFSCVLILYFKNTKGFIAFLKGTMDGLRALSHGE